MCNLYSITTNQAAIIALFRVVNRYVGNLAPMPGVFSDYPAPVVRNTRWPRPCRFVTQSGNVQLFPLFSVDCHIWAITETYDFRFRDAVGDRSAEIKNTSTSRSADRS
jgi:hypothetical protein